MVATYKKKPVEVQAVQWLGNMDEIAQFTENRAILNAVQRGKMPVLIIPTLEGEMMASWGDYIIRGVNGEFYPCKEDIFNKTYELA